MKRSSHLWAKTLLAGTLLFAGLPLVAPHQAAYAATTQITATSQSDVADQLYQALMNRDAQTTISYKGTTTGLKAMLQDAFEQALEKDPYTHYILDSYGLNWRQSSSAAKVTVQMNYRETAAQTAYVQSQVKQILSTIITSGMNDHEKVKAIHDWVVRNVKYDETYTRYTAYEALHDGTAVCQGYALLTYELLRQSGIQNLIVEGTAGGELHAWNLVNLDGTWYHLDTTWDDPVPDQGNYVQTSYYLLTDSQMKQDHNWTKTYPAASTTYQNTLSKLVAAGGDKTSVYQQLQRALDYSGVSSNPTQSSNSTASTTSAANGAISTPAALQAQVQSAQTNGKHTLVFRYSGNLTSLKSDLRTLSSIGIRSISYTVQSGSNTSDLKVTLNWQ
ncbi:transglutaminase domain-containing protein [Paenibacillus sp. WLX2291]|uniref:transglutaminase domain-containing protein n=1 Tax=Paenibacillus sp. WLX2291 TaxID=3296934 RepID=UPI003983EB77